MTAVNVEFLLNPGFIKYVKEMQNVEHFFDSDRFKSTFAQIKDASTLTALCQLFSEKSFSVFLQKFKTEFSNIIRSDDTCLTLAKGLSDKNHKVFIENFVCSDFLTNKSADDYVAFYKKYPVGFRTSLLAFLKHYTFNGQGEKLAFIQKFSPEYYKELVEALKPRLQQDFKLSVDEQNYEAITIPHDTVLLGTILAAKVGLKDPPAFLMPQNLLQLIEVMNLSGVTEGAVTWAHHNLKNLMVESINAVKGSDPILTAFLNKYAEKFQFGEMSLEQLVSALNNCTDDNRVSFLNCVNWSSLMETYSLLTVINTIESRCPNVPRVADCLTSQLVRYKQDNIKIDCSKWFKETPQLLMELSKDGLIIGKALLNELIKMNIRPAEMEQQWSKVDKNDLHDILDAIPEAQSYLLQFFSGDQCWMYLTPEAKVKFLIDNPRYIINNRFLDKRELVRLMEDQSVPQSDRTNLVIKALIHLGTPFYEDNQKLSIKALQATRLNQNALSGVLLEMNNASCIKKIREDIVKINQLDKQYKLEIASNDKRYRGAGIRSDIRALFSVSMLGGIVCGILAAIFLAPLIAGPAGAAAACIGAAAVGGVLIVLAIDLITGLLAMILNGWNATFETIYTIKHDALISDYGSEEARDMLITELMKVNEPEPEPSNRNGFFDSGANGVSKAKQAPDLSRNPKEDDSNDMGCGKVLRMFGFGA